MESAMMQAASRMLRAAQNHWHRLGRDESGSALALLAVLPVLAIFALLARQIVGGIMQGAVKG